MADAGVRGRQIAPLVLSAQDGAYLERQVRRHRVARSLSEGEIRFGIEQLEDAGRCADIHLWLDRMLRPSSANRVLATTEDVISVGKPKWSKDDGAATRLDIQICLLRRLLPWKI